jgi:hypothetical protein
MSAETNNAAGFPRRFSSNPIVERAPFIQEERCAVKCIFLTSEDIYGLEISLPLKALAADAKPSRDLRIFYRKKTIIGL